MNIKTSLSIYNKQWLIEPNAALQMLEFWERVKAGEMKWDYRRAKATSEEEDEPSYRIYQKLFEREGVIVAPESSWDMADFKGFDGASVAIIPVAGPLMKHDFCGMLGMHSLRSLVNQASNTASVKTILTLHDSPGGTTDGTKLFADAIKASPKRTISLIEGMMASADYWVGSASDEVYATSATDAIGSIGTMMSFYDSTEALKARGVVLREYYASKSTDKNRAFREARDGDGKMLVEELLDPTNNIFLNDVRNHRNGKIGGAGKEDVLTGKVYLAEEATRNGLIDGIKSMEEVMEMSMQGGKRTIHSFATTTTTQTTPNKMEATTVLTLAALKAEQPNAYKAAVDEERDRVTALLAFLDIDSEAVVKAIKEGTGITETFKSEMMVKALSKQRLAALEEDSAGVVTTTAAPTTTGAPTAEEKLANDVFDRIGNNIKGSWGK